MSRIRGNTKSKDGFILIVGFCLLMFCAALAYSLLFLTQAHMSLSKNQEAHFISRQNAQAALNTAIGRIHAAMQSHSHATIPSDAAGNAISHNGWTGMLAKDGHITWLVSGNKPKPTISLSSDNSIYLLRSPLQGREAVVPLDPIYNHKKQKIGAMAYLIMDQSTKVSLQRFKIIDEKAGPFIDEPSNQRIRQESSHWWYNNDFAEKYQSANHRIDFLERNFRKIYFHDICEQHNHTPIDLRTGKIKQILDINQAPRTTSGLFLNDAFSSFLSLNVDESDSAQFAVPSDQQISGETTPVHQQIPIITECGIYVTVRKSQQIGDASLFLYIRIRTELWNPYAFPLTIPPEMKKWKIEIEGLDDLTVTWKTNNGINQLESKNINLSKLLKDNDVIMKSLPNVIPPGSILVRNCDVKIDMDAIAIACTRTKDYVSISSPETKLSIRFKAEDENSLAYFKDIPFKNFNSDRYAKHKLSSSKVFDEYDNYTTLYHFSRKDELTPPDIQKLSDLERWFIEADLRENHISLSADTPTVRLFHISKDPAFAYDVDSDAFSGAHFFYAPIFEDPKRQFRVFDATAIYPRNLSHLQHLQIKNMPAFSIGNPYGKQWNRIFDSFVPNLLFEELEEHSLVKKIPLGYVYSSEENASPPDIYQICGAFNVNSCSVFAWKAMLQGFTTKSWTYRTFHQEPPLQREDLRHGFFRLRHGADRLIKHPGEDFPSYPGWNSADAIEWMYLQQEIPWLGAYSFAAREITEENRDALAQSIVSEIKTYGKGFFDISDFLNSGVLQKAIDKTNINTLSGLDYEKSNSDTRIPRMAPSFLSQADVFALISDRVCTRGESFIIRAAGSTINPATSEVIAISYCEVKIQFIPVLRKDGSIEFFTEISDFRWLHPADL